MASEIDPTVSNEELHMRTVGIDYKEVLPLWGIFQDKPNIVSRSRPWALYVLVKWCELKHASI